MQFIFGVLILRTSVGFNAFKGLGNQVSVFLDYTNVGAEFVFGADYTKHFFAFKVPFYFIIDLHVKKFSLMD